MDNNLQETYTTEDTSLTPMEIVLGVDQNGRTTAKKLYKFLELDSTHYAKWCSEKIIKNEFAEEHKDYEVLALKGENPQGGRPTVDYKLTASFAKKLAMGTHNARGEQAKNYFIKVENMLRQKNINEAELSPSLRMFKQIFDSVAKQEIKQKQLQQAVTETKQELEGVRKVIQIRPSETWREETNNLLKKICFKLKDYKTPRAEVYKALGERAGCNLDIRLKNMQARALLNGVSKAKAYSLNYLDVIREDKKLTEIYVNIVKEMAIKYKV